MSKITNDCLTQSAWHRMLDSCTHTATVGVKGLKYMLLLIGSSSHLKEADLSYIDSGGC